MFNGANSPKCGAAHPGRLAAYVEKRRLVLDGKHISPTPDGDELVREIERLPQDYVLDSYGIPK